MFIRNGLRFNIDASQEIDGVRYPNFRDPVLREQLGITEIADPQPPEDFSDDTYYRTEQDDAPYVVFTRKPAAQIVAVLWERINAKRDTLQESGCQVGAHWFHNDLKSRSQWERMASRSAAMQPTDPYQVGGQQVSWKTMTGDFVPLTAGLIADVVAAFEIQEVAIFVRAETLRAQIAAVEFPEQVDVEAGWPSVYVPPVAP
jgi:hypothetical protein